MKRVLVLSDSHGNVNNMILAVRREKPDCRQEFLERILLIEGKKILICHGHTYNVKAGYMNLQYGAQEKGVDAALFGHTHRVFYDTYNGITYINPGSIGSPPYGVPPSYAVLEIDGSTDMIDYEIKYIE